MRTLPLAEAKAQLSKLVDEVASRDEQVLITRRGRPAAMLVSPDAIDNWQATVEILRDPEFMEDIRRGLQGIEDGRVLTEEQWDALFEEPEQGQVPRRQRRPARRPHR